MHPHGQSLPSAHLALLLDAAANGADKGAQQYFTRPAFAQALLRPLVAPTLSQPTFGDRRLIIADLTGCGGGDLLKAARLRYGIGTDLYGADIDPRRPVIDGGQFHKAHADLTRLAPLLAEVGWQCQFWLSNPPYSLRWHAHRLAYLADSGVRRVRQTWSALHPLAVREGDGQTLDSTLASYLIGLDRLTDDGEGVLLTTWSAWEKHLAPTPAADHAWAIVRIPGGGHWFQPTVGDYDFALVYFAAEHRRGIDDEARLTLPDHADDLTVTTHLDRLHALRRQHCDALPARHDPLAGQRRRAWDAAVAEYRQRHDPEARPAYNLTLRPDGRIEARLTPYQHTTGHLPHETVAALQRLDGQTPMGLAVQRTNRQTLLEAVRNPLWRVDPALVHATDQAIAAYHAERAPLYPLAPVQRLGYLDEADTIRCLADGLGPFQAGHSYRIETRTESATYLATINDSKGDRNEVQRLGKELILLVFPDDDSAHDPVTGHRFILGGGKYRYESEKDWPADRVHTFADLVDHFHIPEVPDIATVQPDRYQSHLAQLDRIERRIAACLAASGEQ